MSSLLLAWLLPLLGLLVLRSYTLVCFFLAPFMGLCVLTWSAGERAGGLPLPVFATIATGCALSGSLGLRRKSLIESKSLLRSWYLWIGFAVVVVGLSLYAPLRAANGGYEQLVNGGLEPVDADSIGGASRRLLVLVAMIFSAAAISEWIARSERRFQRACKCVMISTLFVAAWGCAELAFAMLGWPFPGTLFHNNPVATAQGHMALSAVWPNLRTASVALEPSIMAQFLMCGACLHVPALLAKTNQHRTFYFAGVVLLLVGLWASGTRTGYVGLAFIFTLVVPVSVLPVFRRTRLLSVIVVSVSLVSLASSLILGLAEMKVQGQIDNQAYSVVERFTSFVTGLEVFRDHPLIGAGFGVIRVHDTMVNLLANTGLVGFGAYLLANIHLLVKSCNRNVQDTSGMRMLGLGVVLSYVWLCVAGAVSGWPYIHPHYWVILALLMGYIELAKRYARGTRERLIKSNPDAPFIQC